MPFNKQNNSCSTAIIYTGIGTVIKKTDFNVYVITS